jgi:ABC-type amino acid transport substrate-binding protein
MSRNRDFGFFLSALLASMACGLDKDGRTPRASRQTLEENPGQSSASLVLHVVPPQATDPAIDQALDPHYVWLDREAQTNHKLLMFLPGHGAQPEMYQLVQKEAARLGYHVIGLMYVNGGPRLAIGCAVHADRSAQNACWEETHLEILDGIHRDRSVVTVNVPNSIYNRLRKVLKYLAAQHPEEGWSQFLAHGEPRWSRIAVGGHSQGGAQAAMIAKSHAVARVVVFSSPPDAVRTTEAAPWVGTHVTPAARYFGLAHKSEPLFGPIHGSWMLIGMAAFGGDERPELIEPPYHFTHMLVTELPPRQPGLPNAFHISTAADEQTPLGADGTPLLRDAWRYMLGAEDSDEGEGESEDERFVPHLFCTIASTWDPQVGRPSRDALSQLSPSGTKLRVGVSTTNPHYASLKGGVLVGPGIDLACRLAAKLRLPIEFSSYANLPDLLTAFRANAFEIGFAFDPSLADPDLALTNPYVGVPNTYVVSKQSSFMSVSDVDHPGVKVGATAASSPAVYLARHLKFATLMTYGPGGAQTALLAGGIDALASGRAANAAFVNANPTKVRMISENIFYAMLAPFMHLDDEDGVCYLNTYIEAAKTSGLINQTLARITPPVLPNGSIVAPAMPTCARRSDEDDSDGDGAEALGPFSDWSAPVNLGPVVNSPFDDHHPAISANGLSIYITSTRPNGFGTENIWVSQREDVDAAWGPPRNLGPVVNVPGSNTGVPNFSPDGHRMFFNSNRPGGFGRGDLYVSFREDTDDDFGWQAAVNLGPKINEHRYEQCAPTYFEDEKSGLTSLYFCSFNRPPPDGLGDYDIFVSILGSDGTFGPGVLVRELSSPFRDTRTALRSDGLEMFITSNRPGSIGKLDIWVSTRKTTSDPWSPPIDVGPVVNAKGGRQGAPALSADGTTMFFYADGRSDGLGGRDLYVTTRTKLKN